MISLHLLAIVECLMSIQCTTSIILTAIYSMHTFIKINLMNIKLATEKIFNRAQQEHNRNGLLLT